MPDINGKPLRSGTPVVVICPNPTAENHSYDGKRGEITAVWPGAKGAEVQVRFDDGTPAHLFEGYELQIAGDDGKHRSKLLTRINKEF